MVWCGMEWCGMEWCGVAQCIAVRFGIMKYGIVNPLLKGMGWYRKGTVWYSIQYSTV